MVRILLAALLLLSLTSTVSAKRVKKWKVWEGCSYVPNESANDGDSFWIKYKKRKYKIRLYFVDTPETSEDEVWAIERLKAQAAYFKTDDITYTRKVGERAKKFTQKALSKSGGFTVYTRLDTAMGRGKERYYAMVKVDGSFLSELLTENGYVRLNKRTAIQNPLPDGLTVDKYESRLRRAESSAKRAGLGGWAKKSKKGNNSVEKILQAQREKKLLEPERTVEQRIVQLNSTVAAYSVKTPGKLIRLLRPRTRIKIVGAGSPGMVRIRFNPVPGKIYEVQCRERDVANL